MSIIRLSYHFSSFSDTWPLRRHRNLRATEAWPAPSRAWINCTFAYQVRELDLPTITVAGAPAPCPFSTGAYPLHHQHSPLLPFAPLTVLSTAVSSRCPRCRSSCGLVKASPSGLCRWRRASRRTSPILQQPGDLPSAVLQRQPVGQGGGVWSSTSVHQRGAARLGA